MSGLGGVGKTQIAIEYATRNRFEYPNGVFWVNAETIGGLTSGFTEIARILHLPAADSSDLDRVVRAVTEWLDRTDGWLLILDNVDDRRDVQRFFPVRGTGDLLITSRESVFSELGIPRALEVRELDDDAATQFLLARTGRDPSDPADRAAAAELAAELGRLPLALEQAAAYIAETNAFSAYLSAFRKRRVTLLEKAAGLVAHDTVAVTWAANFEAVETVSAAAADVLRVSALLAPDAIPFELLLDGARALGEPIAQALVESDDLAVAELLRPLARYSLVRSDAASCTFSVTGWFRKSYGLRSQNRNAGATSIERYPRWTLRFLKCHFRPGVDASGSCRTSSPWLDCSTSATCVPAPLGGSLAARAGI